MVRITLRLEDELHEALVSWAEESHRSLNAEITWRLAKTLERPSMNVRQQRPITVPPGQMDVDEVIAEVEKEKPAYEYTPKDCPRKHAHNSFRVCPLCGADSA